MNTGKKCFRAFLVAALAVFFACSAPAPGRLDLDGSRMCVFGDTGEVKGLSFSGREFVFAATSGGLLRLDRKTGRWTSFTMASGLPSNHVLSVLYDSRGSLWVGTDRGVALLDGEKFKSFEVVDGLPSGIIRVLAEGADGVIYAGTERGAARFMDGRWSAFDDTHEFARRAVMDIAVDTDGTIWFAKKNALTHYMGGRRWETFQKNVLAAGNKVGLVSNNLLSMAVDGRGRKWIGTEYGLSAYNGTGWDNHYYRERLGRPGDLRSGFIKDVAVGSGDRVWVAHGRESGEAGLAFLSDDGRWDYLSDTVDMPPFDVHVTAAGPDGDIWFGMSGGVGRVEGGRVIFYPVPRGGAGNHVLSIIPDGAGGVAALTGREALLFSGGKAEAVLYPEGIDIVSGSAAEGTIFVVGADGGLFWMTAQGVWERENHFSGQRVVHISNDGGGLLLATTPEGIYRGRPGEWEEIDTAGLPPDFSPLGSFHGPQGGIWVTGEVEEAGGNGASAIFVIREGRARPAGAPRPAEPYPRISSMIFDADGIPWQRGPAGLYRYEDTGGWRMRTLPVRKGRLSAAAWDDEGRLWVGSIDGGLFCLESGRWKAVFIEGNPLPAVNSILPDNQGGRHIWLGTPDQGILRLDTG